MADVEMDGKLSPLSFDVQLNSSPTGQRIERRIRLGSEV